VTSLPIPFPERAAWSWARPIPLSGDGYLGFGVVVSAIALVGLLPGLLAPSLDSAVFSLVGDRIAAGGIPYVDIWDHKPPGIYLASAVFPTLLADAGAWAASWAISIGSLAMCGVVIASTLRDQGWQRSGWIVAALAVALLASFPISLGGGLSESLAVLPIAIAVRLAAVGPGTPWRRFALGLLLGIAGSITFQAGPAVLGVLAIAIGRDRSIRMAAWSLVGLVAAAALVVLGLGLTGSGATAVSALVEYNRAFSAISALDDPLAGEVLHALLVLSPLIVLAIVGTPRLLADGRLAATAFGALVWIGLTAAFIGLQGRMELHYAALVIVPLTLLAAAGPAHLRQLASHPLWFAPIAGIVTVAFLLSALLVSRETEMAFEARARHADRVAAVSAWLVSETPDGSPLFVWGDSPDIYLATGRQPASRYVYLLPLMTPGYVDEKRVTGVLQGWRANPPAAIVDVGSRSPGAAGLPPMLIDRPTAALDGRNVDMLDPLRQFVRDRYIHAATVGGWPIYRLR
jgi:MFS family permease